jgi:hypothetical protein
VVLVGIDGEHRLDRRPHEARTPRALGAGIPIVEHLTHSTSCLSGRRFFAVPPKVSGFGTFPVAPLRSSPNERNHRMSRLPPSTATTSTNRPGLWDQIVSTRSAAVVDEQGGLRARSTRGCTRRRSAGAADLGAHLRFGVSVERRLLELAIITVGALEGEFSGGRTCRWPESTA